MSNIGERVREFYRIQGEHRAVDRIVEDLLADAYLQTLCSTDDMGHLISIVEGCLLPKQERPNN